MKTMGLFEAKNRFSEVCETVATTGEPVTVTRHGSPIARIVPATTGTDARSVWDTIAESRARYGTLPDDLELPPRETSFNRPNPLD